MAEPVRVLSIEQLFLVEIINTKKVNTMRESNITGVSDRAFSNAIKAKIRDPIRPIRLLDFLTKHEREILLFTSLGAGTYKAWLDHPIQPPSYRGEKFYGYRKTNRDVWLEQYEKRYEQSQD